MSIADLIDTETGTIGRRPSGARLYHRNSRFGEPERRKLDRNLVARILFLAEARDRRTRAKGRHGGLLKAKGLDVLRALLRGFYSHRTGECFPSWEAIAEAAGCCRETVRQKLRILEQLGIIETIRRKVVTSFTSRVARVRIDFAVQTSNSYVFNFALADRPTHGDLALPLLRQAISMGWVRNSAAAERTTSGGWDRAPALAGAEATSSRSGSFPRHRGNTPLSMAASQACNMPEAKFRSETTSEVKTTLPPDLAAALQDLGKLIEATEPAR